MAVLPFRKRRLVLTEEGRLAGSFQLDGGRIFASYGKCYDSTDSAKELALPGPSGSRASPTNKGGTPGPTTSIHHSLVKISASTSRTSVFRGETGTVFAINVCHSIFGPIPAPGYHPEGMYEFKVDLNGDAIEDVSYRFNFSERDQHGKQTYTLLRLTGTDATDPPRPEL